MLWVKDAALTLMEALQPSHSPHSMWHHPEAELTSARSGAGTPGVLFWPWQHRGNSQLHTKQCSAHHSHPTGTSFAPDRCEMLEGYGQQASGWAIQ